MEAEDGASYGKRFSGLVGVRVELAGYWDEVIFEQMSPLVSVP